MARVSAILAELDPEHLYTRILQMPLRDKIPGAISATLGILAFFKIKPPKILSKTNKFLLVSGLLMFAGWLLWPAAETMNPGNHNSTTSGNGSPAISGSNSTATQADHGSTVFTGANATNIGTQIVLPSPQPLPPTPTIPQLSPPIPPANIIVGNGSALSINQQGGVTAGTYITQAPQPRRLSADQKNQLLELLRAEKVAIPTTIGIGFNIVPNVPDAEAFANDIGQVMVAAGFKIVQVDNIMSIGGPTPKGVTVGISGEPDSPAVAKIISLFASISVPVGKGSGGRYMGNPTEKGMIYFIVGFP